MGILIGIGGISRAGKSELAKYLVSKFPDTALIQQDEFVKSESEIPTIKGRIDWEHPDSIDWNKLNETVKESLKNYPYTIIEGLFAFYNKEIEHLMSLKIQLSIDKDRFLALKNIDDRWGNEPKWFIEHIWQCHHSFGQPNNEDDLLKIHNISDSDYESIATQIRNIHSV